MQTCRSRSIESSVVKDLCFFCEQSPGDTGLHEAATFHIDKRVGVVLSSLKTQDYLQN